MADFPEKLFIASFYRFFTASEQNSSARVIIESTSAQKPAVDIRTSTVPQPQSPIYFSLPCPFILKGCRLIFATTSISMQTLL